MKYMTFNRSCTYSCISNLIEEYSFHFEDHEIVKSLSIPYLLIYLPDKNRYVAGGMIQSPIIFNKFLNSLSLEFIENIYTPEMAIDTFDTNEKRCMLGIQINSNMESKHSVIFVNKEKEKYRFLNPKRKNSNEPKYYLFSKDELNKKKKKNFPIGHIVRIKNTVSINVSNELYYTLENIDKYYNALVNYCSKLQNIKSLKETKETLFAPLMLDIHAMMEIIGYKELVVDIQNIRTNYLKAIKNNNSILLTDYIKLENLNEIFSKYKTIIEKYIENYKIAT
jgi:hypothetical protein